MNGKIYKLVNEELGLTYYGSTTQSLAKRLIQHRWKAKKNSNYTSKQLFEKGEVEIILVEEYSCNEKKELYERERFYIQNNECVNKTIPSRTKAEWRNDNRDKIHQQANEKITCECGSIISKSNLSNHKRSKKHQTFLITCNA